VFVGELDTAVPVGDASAEANVATHTGQLSFEPDARAAFSFSQASREIARLSRMASATGGEVVTKGVDAILGRILGGYSPRGE
jgi:hypothetical protein